MGDPALALPLLTNTEDVALRPGLQTSPHLPDPVASRPQTWHRTCLPRRLCSWVLPPDSRAGRGLPSRLVSQWLQSWLWGNPCPRAALGRCQSLCPGISQTCWLSLCSPESPWGFWEGPCCTNKETKTRDGNGPASAPWVVLEPTGSSGSCTCHLMPGAQRHAMHTHNMRTRGACTQHTHMHTTHAHTHGHTVPTHVQTTHTTRMHTDTWCPHTCADNTHTTRAHTWTHAVMHRNTPLPSCHTRDNWSPDVRPGGTLLLLSLPLCPGRMRSRNLAADRTWKVSQAWGTAQLRPGARAARQGSGPVLVGGNELSAPRVWLGPPCLDPGQTSHSHILKSCQRLEVRCIKCAEIYSLRALGM